MIIQAILNLRGTEGSTDSEIHQEILQLCPDVSYTLQDVQGFLRDAIRRGILGYGSQDGPKYMVRSDMARLNKANEKYWRGPGCPQSFYTCSY